MAKTKNSRYIHGTSEEEQQRLSKLNDLTNASFVDFVKVRETDNVLELGSGLGILAEMISRKLSHGSVTGIEISEAQIAKCPPASKRLSFIHGDVHNLPFADDSFDVVYCRYILEHVTDPLGVLKQARRVLKPGGSVFIQENSVLLLEFFPDCPRFKEVWKAFARYQSSIGGDAMIGLALYELLRRTGFAETVLSMAPEIHYHETGTLVAWIDNLISILRGARDPLIIHKFVSAEQFNTAIMELEAFKTNPYASSYFYWNRATAKKPPT
jgi:ubiquinone/menaquinone biosynthesis C-methylase UbiE